MKFHLGTALSVLFVFSSAQAGTVDLGRKTAIDISGLSQNFPTADSVLKALPSGTSPQDFARTMEVLRRAYNTLPKAGPSQLNWSTIQTKPPNMTSLSERDQLIYKLYLQKPLTTAATEAMGMQKAMRVNFAYSYVRYLFEDAWTVGGGINPDRAQRTTQKEQDFAFFKSPYTYVAWGMYQADRVFTEQKSVNPNKSPAEQKDDLWGKICPDVRSARFTFLTAFSLDQAQAVPGFADFGNKAFAAFTRAAQMPLSDDVQKVTGAKSYAELCQLPAKELSVVTDTIAH